MNLLRIGILIGATVITSSGIAQEFEADVRHEEAAELDTVTYAWKTALSPENYLHAIETAGSHAPATKSRQLAAALTAPPWVPIGPTGGIGLGPSNGRIRSIHIQSQGSSYYIYVGASSGGIWRALGSNGPVWTSLGDRLPNPAVGAFAVNPSNPDDILVGTGDPSRYGGAGMFRTTDAGLTWTNVSLPVSPQSFYRVYYLPGNPNVVLAASDSGLLRSVNGPSGNWTNVLDSAITDLVIHPADPNIQYCCRASIDGQGGGVYKSTDAGQTWVLVTSSSAPVNVIGNARISICRDSPNTLAYMYVCSTNSLVEGVRKSTDGGSTWSDITGTGTVYRAEQGFHALAIAFRPNNQNEIYIGVNNFWMTSNGGSSWTRLEGINPHQDQHQLYFNSVTGDSTMWMCNDGGVYTYFCNGIPAISWIGDQNTGLRIAQIEDMDAKRDYRVIGNQDDGTAASANAGANWTGYSCCDIYSVAITDDLSPSESFWFNLDGHVTRQLFAGLSYDVSDTNQLLFSDGNQPETLFYDRFSDKVHSLPASGMTSPNAVLSRPATAASPGTWTSEYVFTDGFTNSNIKGSCLNGRSLYVWGGRAGYVNILQKTNTTWTLQRSSPIGFWSSIQDIVTIVASTERPGESWAGLKGAVGQPKLIHTKNDWQTYADISGSLTNVGQVAAIVAAPSNPDLVFAGTDVGMYYSEDGGANWQEFQDGLPRVRCTGLKYIVDRTRDGNDKLVLATFGRGMYERVIPQLPLVYVDPRSIGRMGDPNFKDGTYEHAYDSIDVGLSNTPTNGILAVHGDTYLGTRTLSVPMTIRAFESPAQLGP